jgi:hypothetical protein
LERLCAFKVKYFSTFFVEIIVRARLAFLLLLVLLTSCTFGSPATSEPTAIPGPTNTPVPTAGPTSTPPAPLVILVIPADMNAELSKAYQKEVYDLSQAQNYRFIVLNKLTTAELEPALKIVVDLSPDTDVAALAAAAPQTQFLAINLPGVQPGGNVSVLGGESIRISQVAFMAGYIGSMITEDYHTGALLVKDSPEAEVITTAMRAGQEFYCGLCNPFAGPFEPYPLVQDIPKDAKPNEYGAYADILIRKKVETLFLQPGVDTPELLEYLPTVGVLMIGTQAPAKNIPGWVVTLQPNYLEALKAAFPDLVAGQGGKVFPAPLSFTNANPDLFSPGKQQNAHKVLEDLLAGFISDGVK